MTALEALHQLHAEANAFVAATVVSVPDQIADFVARLNEIYGDERTTFGVSKGGRKFTRVTRTFYGSASVHCFVDNATGDILKGDGWKRPAKGVRGHVTDEIPTGLPVAPSYCVR